MEGITEIDIIVLSCAQSRKLKEVTERCIESLVASENNDHIHLNIIVIESARDFHPFQYSNTTTVYPDEEFGYNKFMNIGIQMSSSKYICLCNNDLIFHRNWATEILKNFDRYYDLSSASPACSNHHPKIGFEINTGLYTGYRSNFEISGWCIFLKRDILRIIGQFDENFKFWCADNDYSNVLSASKLKHVLVTSSIVDHLVGTTLNQIPNHIEELTADEFFYFEKKWNPKIQSPYWKEL